jgi:hypothetical protein
MLLAPVSGAVPIAGAASPPPYQLKFETVSGSGDDLQLRSLLDRQQFHDPLGEAEREGISSSAWPIFGLLWPSGRVLAHAMLTFRAGRQTHPGARLRPGARQPGGASPRRKHYRQRLPPAGCGVPAGKPQAQPSARDEIPDRQLGRANPLLERFDLIIGSDVLYDRGQPEVLSQFIELHALPHTEVLIVDPTAATGPVSIARWMLWAIHAPKHV